MMIGSEEREKHPFNRGCLLAIAALPASSACAKCKAVIFEGGTDDSTIVADGLH
jgi:hypothetical protein